MLKKNNVLFFILSMFLSILVVFSSVSPIHVKADSSVAGIEKTNVLDDLKDMTIDDKKFSLEDYNFDTKKNTQILSFVEYCYSFYEDKQNDFGLYIYVYNPKGIKFDTTSTLNTIQFATTKETDSAYSKYTLKFLNMSEETNYVGLFYKFKVNLSEAQKTAILNGVNSTSRVYKVSGFELLIEGDTNATDYAIAYTFSFSGYAKGYGPDENSASSLTCLKEGLTTLSLDVHPTTYRPEYTNGKNEYTRDSLHSVYFSVPNDIIAEYGEMTAVHATWLNAVIKPALVVGHQLAWQDACAYLGSSIKNSGMKYCFFGGSYIFEDMNAALMLNCGFSWLDSSALTRSDVLNNGYSYGYNIDKLYLLYNSGSESNSADSYIVSSEELLEQLYYSYHLYGGGLVNGKYAEVMFESVDENFTEINYRSDKEWSLKNIKISQTFWETLFGLHGSDLDNYSSAYNGIDAIYRVNDSDIYGSIVEISKRLYISQSDVDDFRNFYNKNSDDSTIYLFRYQISDFISEEAAIYTVNDSVFGNSLNWTKSSNAYFFQETVNLDFDIIDITFSTGESETVIPVVSNPIDVVGESTPPINTTSDKKMDLLEVLELILGLLVLGFVLYILSSTGLLKMIGDLLLWIIKAPFKFIAWLVNKFRGD